MKKILSFILSFMFITLVIACDNPVESFTVDFNTNGGSEIESVVVEGGQTNFQVSEPTKEGHTFAGWFTDSSLKNSWDGSISQNLTIYAKWTVNQYKLTFVTNTSEEMDELILDYNAKIPTLEEPYKEGYTFAGWYLDSNFEIAYNLANMPAKDVTLYAKFTSNPVEVRFIVDSIAIKTFNVDYNSTINPTDIPTPTEKVGYTFTGWEVDGQLFDFNTVITSQTKIYAAYEINTYTITFNVDGSKEEVSYAYNSQISSVDNPTKVGYEFAGWYITDSVTGEETRFVLANEKMPAKDIELKAHWKVLSFDVIYEVNGGESMPTETYEYNASLNVKTPVRTGYVFAGWYLDYKFETPFEYDAMPAKDVKLYAKWTPIDYTLVFNANGGVGEMNNLPLSFDLTKSLPLNTFTKEGHKFLGWATTADGSVVYKDQSNVSNLTTTKDGVVTLYAVWEVNSYTFTFEVDNVKVATITLTYGSSITLPDDPIKTGYTFAGWDQKVPTTMPASNMTFTALFNINQYSVTFVTNGGSLLTDTSVTQDYQSNVILPTPTKEGYKFLGWYTDEALENKVTSYTVLAKDSSLYAGWEILSYMIIFNTNGGETMESITLDYGSLVPTISNPTRVGYTFNGWDKDIPTNMPANNVTLTASWTINKYTITFVDGDTVLTTITLDYDSTVTAPQDPTKTGYRFDGWNVEIPSRMPAEDLTISAKWTIRSYTLTYVHGYQDPTTTTYNYLATINLDVAGRVGYTFNGWYEDVNFTTPLSYEVMPASNKTIYAKWTTNEYTVSFDTNGGNEIASVTKKYGELVTLPTPVKTGYTFNGWYTNANLTNKVSKYNVPSHDATLYAGWTINQYTITFVDKDKVIYTIEGDYNSEIKSVSNPEKEGYTFVSWSEEIPLTMPAENVTISSNWSINQYTISFYDGNSLIGTITQDYASIINKVESPAYFEYEKEGYTFTKWDSSVPNVMPAEDLTINTVYSINSYTLTIVYGNGTSQLVEVYEYNAKLPKLPTSLDRVGYTFNGWDYALEDTMPAKDVTVNALWQINTYSVSFDSNGGSEVAAQTYEYNASLVAPKNPTLTGYTFSGWVLVDGENTTSFTFDGQVMPANDMLLKATWTINTYKLTMTYISGESATSITLDYKYNSLIDLSVSDIEGYTFGGWYEDINFTTPLSFTNMPAKNTVIYTKWTINSHTINFYDGQTLIKSITQNYGTSIIEVENPSVFDYVKVGYTFTSWDKVVPTIMPDYDVNVYAVYERNAYTLTIVYDNGEEDTVISYLYDEELDALPTNLNKVGHTFASWDKELPVQMPAENLTVKALWTVNSYTIVFDSNGGSEISAQTYNYNEVLVAPKAPTFTGYTFDGWELVDGENTTPFTFDEMTMPANDMLLRAKWTINTYILTIVYLNNERVEIAYVYNTKVSVPQDPVYEGYVFNGWLSEGREFSFVDYYMPAHHVTVNADFENVYTITFYTNTDETPNYVSSGVAGMEVTVPQNLTKLGYTFVGWYSDKDLTQAIEIPAVMPSYSLEVYAKWDVNYYTIKFNADGGDDVEDIYLPYGSEIAASTTTTKVGYEFLGWYTADGKLYTVPSVMGASNVEVTAHWKVLQFSVSFYDGSTLIKSITQDYGTSIIEVENPSVFDYVKVGYTFTSWDKTVPSTMPAEDVEINAVYEINQYTIKLVDGETVLATITQDYASAINPVANPTKTGYTFLSWSRNIPSTMPAENLVITANFEAITYNVVFNDNGGSSDMVDFKATYDKDYCLVATNLERVGYTFLGWSLDKDATVATYKNNDTISNLATTNETVTLYAIWSVNTYTISFNANGGSEVESITLPYGTKIESNTSTSLTGYTFVSWLKADGKVYSIPKTMPAENVELIASWKINQYTITLVDGETVLATIIQDYNTAISAIENPSKVGYTFVKWSEAIPSLMPANDLTISAIYEINSYTLTVVYGNGEEDFVLDYEYGALLPQLPESLEKVGYTFVSWDKVMPETMPANDLTISAIYEINSYTLTIVYGNDKGTVTTAVKYNSEILDLGAQTKVGHNFLGWDTKFPLYMPASDLTITALWEKVEYTLTVVSVFANSTSSESTKLFYQDSLELVAVEVEGYTFVGWYSDINFNDGLDINYMPAEDLTVYAKYEAVEYSLVFDDNHDDGSEVRVNVKYDNTTKTYPLYTANNVGHTFLGWSTESDATEATYLTNDVISNLATAAGSVVTLYAVWETNAYKVTLVDGENTLREIVGLYGSVISPTISTEKIGHKFDGWYLDKELSIAYQNSLTTIPAEDLTLYGKWTARTYTITTYDGDLFVTHSFTYGSEVILEDLIKTGYDFSGWYSDIDTTTLATIPSVMPAENLTIYAGWTLKSYTITLYDGEEIIDTITFEYQANVSVSHLEKEGYNFLAWDKEVPTVMPAENIELYASWTPWTYSIKFTSGNESILVENINYNETYTLPLSTFEKQYYSFAGWTNGSETYLDGATVSALAHHNGVVTMVANWTPVTYTIVYIGDSDTTGEMVDQTVTILTLQQHFLANSYAKVGYSFVGWGLSLTSDEYYTVDAYISEELLAYANKNNEIKLYALWEVLSYEVTYNYSYEVGMNKVVKEEPAEVLYQSELKELSITGYEFGGWYLDSEYTTIAPSTMPAEDITVYGKLTPITYTVKFLSKENSSELISPLTISYNTKIYEYIKDNNKVNPVGHDVHYYLNNVEVTADFIESHRVTSDVTYYVEYTAKEYIVKFIVDNSLLYVGKHKYGTELTYNQVMSNLASTRDMLLALKEAIVALIVGDNSQLGAFAYQYGAKLAELTIYNDTTLNLVVEYFMNIIDSNFPMQMVPYMEIIFPEEYYTNLAYGTWTLTKFKEECRAFIKGKVDHAFYDYLFRSNVYILSDSYYTNLQNYFKQTGSTKWDPTTFNTNVIQFIGGKIANFASQYVQDFYSLTVNASESFAYLCNQKPYVENKIFTGWVLGSKTYYFSTSEDKLYVEKDAYLGNVPAGDETANVEANFIDAPALTVSYLNVCEERECSHALCTNKDCPYNYEGSSHKVCIHSSSRTNTLSWEAGWNNFKVNYIDKYYGKDVTVTKTFEIANYSKNGKYSVLTTTKDLSHTFGDPSVEGSYSVPGDYNVVVRAVVTVKDSSGNEVANFTTLISTPKQIKLTPNLNEGVYEVETADYHYIVKPTETLDEDLKYNIYLFTNSEYSFAGELTPVAHKDGAYNPSDLATVEYKNGRTYVKTGSSYGYFALKSNPDEDVYSCVYILPLIQGLSFSDSLSDYSYIANGNETLFLDKDINPYQIGAAIDGLTITDYQDNAVKLDVVVNTNIDNNLNFKFDKNLFDGYMIYDFYYLNNNPSDEDKLTEIPAHLYQKFVEYILSDNPLSNDTYKFTDISNDIFDDYAVRDASGRLTYVLEISFGQYSIPRAVKKYIPTLKLKFQINDCINVYTHETLQSVYANLNYRNGINLHDNITTVVSDVERYTEAAVKNNEAIKILIKIEEDYRAGLGADHKHGAPYGGLKVDYRDFLGEMVDIDGDGIKEQVYYSPLSSAYYYPRTGQKVLFDGSPLNFNPYEIHYIYAKPFIDRRTSLVGNDDFSSEAWVEYFDYISTFRTGNIYFRGGIVSPEYHEDYVLNGNYFEVDGSGIDYLTINSTYNQSTIDGYEVPNCYASIFGYYVHTNITEYNSEMTHDYEQSYSEKYQANGNTMTFTNFSLLGNTSATHEAGDSLHASAIQMMNRNSGGHVGIAIGFGGTLNVDNTIVKGATLGIAARYESAANINQAYLVSNWANSIYLHDSTDVVITKSFIKDSGGAAIHVEDTESKRDSKLNYTYTNPHTVKLDTDTVIENYIIGTEGYFNAYGMTAAVPVLKAGIEPQVNSVQDPTLSAFNLQLSVINKRQSYLGNEAEMLNFIYMATPAGQNGGTDPVCHIKLVYIDSEGNEIFTRSGNLTNPSAIFDAIPPSMGMNSSGQLVLTKEGLLALTYNIPGKGISVLGLGMIVSPKQQ